MKASTWVACVALAVLALVVLFPPAEIYRPATRGIWLNGIETPGTAEIIIDQGFTFIGEIGGRVIIRYQQWYSLMGAVVFIGGIVFAITARKPK